MRRRNYRQLEKTLERTFRQNLRKMTDPTELTIQSQLDERSDGRTYIDEEMYDAIDELNDLLGTSIRNMAISDTRKVELRKIRSEAIHQIEWLLGVFERAAQEAAEVLRDRR